jgi:hypothetical protein
MWSWFSAISIGPLNRVAFWSVFYTDRYSMSGRFSAVIGLLWVKALSPQL